MPDRIREKKKKTTEEADKKYKKGRRKLFRKTDTNWDKNRWKE